MSLIRVRKSEERLLGYAYMLWHCIETITLHFINTNNTRQIYIYIYIYYSGEKKEKKIKINMLLRSIYKTTKKCD